MHIDIAFVFYKLNEKYLQIVFQLTFRTIVLLDGPALIGSSLSSTLGGEIEGGILGLFSILLLSKEKSCEGRFAESVGENASRETGLMEEKFI